MKRRPKIGWWEIAAFKKSLVSSGAGESAQCGGSKLPGGRLHLLVPSPGESTWSTVGGPRLLVPGTTWSTVGGSLSTARCGPRTKPK